MRNNNLLFATAEINALAILQTHTMSKRNVQFDTVWQKIHNKSNVAKQ